jgi:hypothetical protein
MRRKKSPYPVVPWVKRPERKSSFPSASEALRPHTQPDVHDATLSQGDNLTFLGTSVCAKLYTKCFILEEPSWKAQYLNKSAQGKEKMLLLARRQKADARSGFYATLLRCVARQYSGGTRTEENRETPVSTAGAQSKIQNKHPE